MYFYGYRQYQPHAFVNELNIKQLYIAVQFLLKVKTLHNCLFKYPVKTELNINPNVGVTTQSTIIHGHYKIIPIKHNNT